MTFESAVTKIIKDGGLRVISMTPGAVHFKEHHHPPMSTDRRYSMHRNGYLRQKTHGRNYLLNPHNPLYPKFQYITRNMMSYKEMAQKLINRVEI